MENEMLKEKLMELDRNRKEYEDHKDVLKINKEHFDSQNEALINTINLFSDNISKVSEEIRELAITLYDGEDKNIGYGVKIRELKSFEYDEKTALEWAIEHKQALKLDATKFKKIAQIDAIDFVTIEIKPSATLPTKIEIIECF